MPSLGLGLQITSIEKPGDSQEASGEITDESGNAITDESGNPITDS